jgi:ribosomal protein S18 acetylase RimI-like enzyme
VRLELVPADRFELEELAALFTAGYEGYFMPVHVDGPALASMVKAWDIDLTSSRVAVRDGEPVGVGMLGVRGDRGWVGGLGVVTAARRTGVGRALMEAILAEATPDVGLEVMEQNEAAIRLYDDLGFERTRVLEVWSLAAEAPDHDVRTVEARPLAQAGLPWQRADESLPPEYERIEVDGGAALIRVNGGRVSVLQLAADGGVAAQALLGAARNRGESLQYVNVPAGDSASAALAELGANLDLRQVEMRLTRSRNGPTG